MCLKPEEHEFLADDLELITPNFSYEVGGIKK